TAAQPVDYHLAIRSRSSYRVHDQLSSRGELEYASFKFFPRQTLDSIVGDNQGFNAKLLETITQNFSCRFLEINQSNPGGKFPAAGYDGNSGFQHFVHNRSHSCRETLFWLGFSALAKEQKANPWVQKY